MRVAPSGSQKTPGPCDESITSITPTAAERELAEEIDIILERQRNGRVLSPLAVVKAWQTSERRQTVTAEEVHAAWQHFKARYEAALAGGDFDGLQELHDDWRDKLEAWLNGPCC